MADEIKVVTLEAMRVVSFHGFGETPEDEAFTKMAAWAGARGLLEDAEKVKTYGFNNPSPSPGSPNYGYDVWLVVGPDVEGDDEAELIEFEGGLYAVLRNKGLPNIGEAWQRLVKWREEKGYKHAAHQWLEGSVEPYGQEFVLETFELDLYLPIAE